MIRAAFGLLLMLALGAGDTPRMLCEILCDVLAPVEAAEECHHDQSTAQTFITPGPGCADGAFPGAAVIRDDIGRATASASKRATAVATPSTPPQATIGRAVIAPSAVPTAGNRPRTTILRI